MCATCGCNYKNYEHRPDEMVTKMPASFYGTTKVADNMPKVPSVPARKNTTKK